MNVFPRGAAPHSSGPAQAAGQLARGVAMKTGELEATAFNNLLSKVSMTLMKGLSSMVMNRN